MRKRTKTKKASDKAVAARVTKEMAKPRMARSAKLISDRDRKAQGAKKHPVGGTAPDHTEQYGTGTPAVKTRH